MTPRNLSAPASATLLHDDQDGIAAPASDVRTWLLASSALGTVVGKPDRRADGSAIDAHFAESAWLCRALAAYQRCSTAFDVLERTRLDAWLRTQGDALASMLDRQLATAPADTVLSTERMHDARAVPVSALYYNNRRAMQALAVGLIGAYLKAPTLIDCAVSYVQAWVKRGVWPDGAQSDWTRANDKVPQQGLIYAWSNIGCVLELAMRLDMIGDRRLLDYSTRGGLTMPGWWPAKTIWTPCDRQMRIEAGEPFACDPRTGPAGMPMHWTYALPALRRYGRASSLPIATADRLDFGWRAWSGVVGMRADVRA